MNPSRKPRAIVVTRDPAVLRELIAAGHPSVEFIGTQDAAQVRAMLKQELAPIAVIAEYSAGSHGVFELLLNVRTSHPQVRRMVVTDFADMSLVVEGLHSGAIDAVLYRTVDSTELRSALRLAAPPTTVTPASPPLAGARR
jgi:DNA-binding NarL/FixJ family response regulator